jgi:hypothetical protein
MLWSGRVWEMSRAQGGLNGLTKFPLMYKTVSMW